MKLETLSQTGLQPIPPHLLSAMASHAQLFGSAPLSDLPATFDFIPEFMKNQKFLDFCATFSGTAVSETQEGIELDPLSLFAWTKELIGPDAYLNQGLNLLDVANAFTKIGALSMDHAPYTDIDTYERDFLANPANYPQELKMLASDHRKASVLNAATGPYDIFDNIRSTIWMNRMSRQTVHTGSIWYKAWLDDSGIIPETYSSESIGGHAYKIFGWETLEDGQPYLLIQNSWGQDVGDKGIFYMSRAVANKELNFGSLIYNDLPQDIIDYHAQNGLAIADNPMYKLLKLIINAVFALFKIKQ